MATSNGQRIGILIIAIVMLVGTIGSFAAMVLANENASIDQALEEAEYEEQLAEYQKQMEEQAKEQAEASRPLDGYSAEKFDKDSIDSLQVDTLKKGSGEEVTEEDTIEANYFGWTADGKIFDSTNKDGTVTPAEFPLSQVIPGWTEGLAGVKVGSVVKLSIPSDKAYGTAGSPPNIGPDEPLQFIVEVLSIK